MGPTGARWLTVRPSYDQNAICLFHPLNNTHTCESKPGYKGSGQSGDCQDRCEGRCRNQGQCLKDKAGNPYCQCAGSYYGDKCETKSEFAYIAGGIAGAIIFLILLVLLIWMICVRATRPKKQEKVGLVPEPRWLTVELQTSTTEPPHPTLRA